jgi:stage II sporulation protein P
MKWTCLILSALLFFGVFFALPHIVSALPYFSARDINELFQSDEKKTAIPTFALTAGDFDEEGSGDESGQYAPDEEETIPPPTPGDGDLSVSSDNLCWYELGETATLDIINRTSYSVRLKDYLSKSYPVKCTNYNEKPLVLIIHTHGSESYLPNGYDFYSPNETFRSIDETKNVVHIGELLARELANNGIIAVHDKTLYDQTDFNRSYNYSREGIKKALAENPSIKYIIDIHRDSVFDSDGNNIKPLTEINGEKCAQVMLVVGTDEAGAAHSAWRENLTFATHLQQRLNDMFPTLARPVNLRTSAFNQAFSVGSVLLEVGACGNTMEEAENAIKLFSQAYISLIRQNLQ